jgi:hypothetical protein
MFEDYSDSPIKYRPTLKDTEDEVLFKTAVLDVAMELGMNPIEDADYYWLVLPRTTPTAT